MAKSKRVTTFKKDGQTVLYAEWVGGKTGYLWLGVNSHEYLLTLKLGQLRRMLALAENAAKK